MKPYILKPHLTRKITFMKKDDARVPQALFETVNVAPDLKGFPYPLPSKKSDYTCFAEGNNGVIWYGAKTGLTRYDAKAERPEDIIMFFSAHKHLDDDEVKAILPEGDNVWVLNGEDSVSYIEMIMLTCEERGDLLREESHKYVMRRGMICHMNTTEPKKIETALGYTACDNDGTFTGDHFVGEAFRYAVLKRELGEDHPKTIEARKFATLTSEAMLLLTYVHGRDEGFIARSYHVTGEPLPDDGHFYQRKGDVATCCETNESKKTGRVGEQVPCTHPIPDRLAKLYRDLGYTENDLCYKADTSSDEVTNHFLHYRLAHDILGEGDPELDELIKDSCRRTMTHIINGKFEFLEHSGKPTTWAKWSKRYFAQAGSGYVDAPLNAAELLMYLKVTMHVTGEEGLWKETYDALIADGYAELSTKHFDRFFHGAMGVGASPEEDLMYGDNLLALATFWMLCTLEEDEELLATYRKSFKTWSNTLLREVQPGYAFPMLAGCPDIELDFERMADWFYRHEITRHAALVRLERHDVPVKRLRHGADVDKEMSVLLMPDERSTEKFDRNPFQYLIRSDARNSHYEGCYPYTFAYWAGRYYGFIAEEGQK